MLEAMCYLKCGLDLAKRVQDINTYLHELIYKRILAYLGGFAS